MRVCQLLITQLQNLLDPTCEPALQQADLKIVLRVVRTVLGHFYRQLKSKCGVFIETLLGGLRHDCLTAVTEPLQCGWTKVVFVPKVFYALHFGVHIPPHPCPPPPRLAAVPSAVSMIKCH